MGMCWLYLKQQAGAAVEPKVARIMVATADIKPGTMLNRDMFEVRAVPAEMTGITGTAVRPEFAQALLGQ
jgi:hypothetical protein